MKSPPWQGWCADTLRPIIWYFRSPSNRSGILYSIPTRDLGRILIRRRNPSERHFHVSIPWGRGHHYGPDYHWNHRQTCRTSPSKTHSDPPRKLDGFIHGHRTSRWIPTGQYQVLVQGPLPTPLGRPHWDKDEETPWLRGSTDGSDLGTFSDGCLLSPSGKAPTQHMCVTNPSYNQVAPCKAVGTNCTGKPHLITHQRWRRTHNRRETSWSGTYGQRGWTIFSLCVLLIQMPPPKSRRH